MGNPVDRAKLGILSVCAKLQPAATPLPVVSRLSADLQKVMAMPEVGQRLQQIGADAKWMGPAEFAGFVGNEVTRLPKILADIGVQPQ